jgi:hypothetical protein
MNPYEILCTTEWKWEPSLRAFCEVLSGVHILITTRQPNMCTEHIEVPVGFKHLRERGV